MAPKPIRIAVLEADTPIGNTKKQYGGYTGVFTSLLHKAADAISLPRDRLEFSQWDVVNKMEYPEPDAIDAVLITGSRHNAFDSDPWILKLVSYVKNLLTEETHVRVIGVCYGHQIVGRALGSTVARSQGGAWEVSVCDMSLTPVAKDLFQSSEDQIPIFQMHRDVLLTYPEGVIPLGSSPKCEVQGMYIPKRMISVEGHPEFTEDIVREILDNRRKKGIFEGEIYEDAVRRVGNKQNGVQIATGFLRFLTED